MSIDQPESERDQGFVTVSEAARRLGRSKLSLYQACARGEVPGAFKIGAKWLVNWSAFVKATESATQGHDSRSDDFAQLAGHELAHHHAAAFLRSSREWA